MQTKESIKIGKLSRQKIHFIKDTELREALIFESVSHGQQLYILNDSV